MWGKVGHWKIQNHGFQRLYSGILRCNEVVHVRKCKDFAKILSVFVYKSNVRSRRNPRKTTENGWKKSSIVFYKIVGLKSLNWFLKRYQLIAN